MPDVVGLPLRKARLLVQNAGLVVDAIRFQESYETRDTVLEQKPPRGQMVYAGDKVTLTRLARELRQVAAVDLPALRHQRAQLLPRLPVDHPAPLRLDRRASSTSSTPYFDPYEAPEKFLPWLASWSAMVLEEDWPLEKKRRLIRKAIELYRIRGTVKGLKLFISLFTGHEPDIKENEWPFRGWRIGATSEIGIDSVVLPPVNLAHTFIVEMPVTLQGRLARVGDPHPRDHPDGEAGEHAVLPALRLRGRRDDLSEFMAIGGGVIGGIGLGAREAEVITSEEDLKRARGGGQADADSAAGDGR